VEGLTERIGLGRFVQDIKMTAPFWKVLRNQLITENITEQAAREIDASKQELQATREQLPTTQDELTSTKMQLMDAWQQIKAIRGRCTRAPTFV
jgi:hypothetical protein